MSVCLTIQFNLFSCLTWNNSPGEIYPLLSISKIRKANRCLASLLVEYTNCDIPWINSKIIYQMLGDLHEINAREMEFTED